MCEKGGGQEFMSCFLSEEIGGFWKGKFLFLSKPHPPFLVSWKMEDVTIKSSKIKVLFTPLKPLLRH